MKEKPKVSENGANSIQAMFNTVAPRYDFLNRFLSIGYDRYWRRLAVDEFESIGNKTFLDVATGTADIALEIAGRNPSPLKIIGMDFSSAMLKLGNEKITAKHYGTRIKLFPGSAEELPLKDQTFDGAITAFGVRNFADASLGIREMFRVLKPGGKIVVLEFSFPKNGILRALYRFYFDKILPFAGRWVSGHKTAYSYLPASVATFPQGSAFKEMLADSGFINIVSRPLTLGIVTLYSGLKNAAS